MGPAWRLLAGACLAAAALAAAVAGARHVQHRRALDLAGFEAEAHAAIARARALAAAAERFSDEEALAALPPNPKSGPVFRFDERLARAAIDPAPAAAAPRPRLAFEFEGTDPVALRPLRSQARMQDGILVVEHVRDDYLVTGPGFDAGDEAIAEIALRIRLARGTGFELAWSGKRLDVWPEGEEGEELERVSVDVVPDGEFHVYRVNAEHVLRLRAGRRVRTLFLMPSDADSDRVEIDYLRVVTKRESFAGSQVGRAHEARQGELRAVLFAATPRRLVYDVRVPETAPRLELGLAVLESGDPVDFAVTVEEGGRTTRVLARRVASPETWTDAALDLTRFAGRDVRIALEATSARGNVALWAHPRLSGAPRERLHVLVVVEDTLRGDRISALGHARPTSPERDALAARGVLFEGAIAQDNKTRPSVPSYMTGLPPSATGVWSFQQHLDGRFATLAEILRNQGFTTASFVQNTNAGPAAGLQQGFDQLWDQRALGTRPESVYGERVLDWIAAHRDRNLFAYLHLLDPHGIYDPPAPWDGWYREAPGGSPVERNPDLDPAWVEQPTREGRGLLYDGEVRNNDALLGGLLRGLARLGTLDDTLVVLLSDHGEHLGEHGLFDHQPPGFVQVLHVPLVMAHPRLLPAGRRVREPVALLDVVPTLLELAGVDARGLLLAGDSLVPLARGDRARFTRRLVYSEESISYDRDRPARVRASAFVGPRHFLHTRHQGVEGLLAFDRAADPAEERTLAAARDPLVARRIVGLLRELKLAYIDVWRGVTRGDPEDVLFDPAAQEQLRALGYVE